jgi:hypothetical protein
VPTRRPLPPGIVPKTDRIQICIGLMASGAWINGVTGPRLAKEWGIRVETVSRDAAEASRTIRGNIISHDDLRARLHLMLTAIIADCDAVKRSCGTKSAATVGALKTKIEAIKALAGLEGVEAPRQIQVGGTLVDLFW